MTVRNWEKHFSTVKDITCPLREVLFSAKQSKMEYLPEEVLLLIFQNIEPLELISLSRVNRCWRKLAIIPQLHRLFNANEVAREDQNSS